MIDYVYKNSVDSYYEKLLEKIEAIIDQIRYSMSERVKNFFETHELILLDDDKNIIQKSAAKQHFLSLHHEYLRMKRDLDITEKICYKLKDDKHYIDLLIETEQKTNTIKNYIDKRRINEQIKNEDLTQIAEIFSKSQLSDSDVDKLEQALKTK